MDNGLLIAGLLLGEHLLLRSHPADAPAQLLFLAHGLPVCVGVKAGLDLLKLRDEASQLSLALLARGLQLRDLGAARLHGLGNAMMAQHRLIGVGVQTNLGVDGIQRRIHLGILGQLRLNAGELLSPLVDGGLGLAHILLHSFGLLRPLRSDGIAATRVTQRRQLRGKRLAAHGRARQLRLLGAQLRQLRLTGRDLAACLFHLARPRQTA